MMQKEQATKLRWGVVGTGSIARQMAPMIHQADSATLVAVASRRRETAQAFAAEYGAEVAHDAWQDMIASDAIDALYVATPTSLREEICLAAAACGKHVLAEKPFASFASLERITAACRAHGVGFMDGTHFVHHPRTPTIRTALPEHVGQPVSIASAFLADLGDPGDIRMDPSLEPLGAIGDLGWYNVRAAVEYLAPDVDVESVSAFARRHPDTGAVLAASGLVVFSDESTTTFHCGFDSQAENNECRIAGPLGEISMWRFSIGRPDGSAGYTLRRRGLAPDSGETILVPAAKPAAALMFDDFAAMIHDPARFEASVTASERTQRWLDAVFEAATT